MTVLSFEATDWTTWRSIQGLLRLDVDELVVEFRVEKGNRFDKSPIQELRIGYDRIASASFRAGWFNDTVTIQTISIRDVEGLPNGSNGRVQLNVNKADRETSRKLISFLAPTKPEGIPADDFV